MYGIQGGEQHAIDDLFNLQGHLSTVLPGAACDRVFLPGMAAAAGDYCTAQPAQPVLCSAPEAAAGRPQNTASNTHSVAGLKFVKINGETYPYVIQKVIIMSGETKITVINNLCADPRVELTAKGVAMVRTTVASLPACITRARTSGRMARHVHPVCGVAEHGRKHCRILQPRHGVVVHGNCSRWVSDDGQKRSRFEMKTRRLPCRWSAGAGKKVSATAASRSRHSGSSVTLTRGAHNPTAQLRRGSIMPHSRIRVNRYPGYYELTPVEGFGSVTITGKYSRLSLQKKLRELRKQERSFRKAEVSIEEAEPFVSRWVWSRR